MVSKILSACARSHAWSLLSMMHEKRPLAMPGAEWLGGGQRKAPWCNHPQRVVVPSQVGIHRGCGTPARVEGEELKEGVLGLV